MQTKRHQMLANALTLKHHASLNEKKKICALFSSSAFGNDESSLEVVCDPFRKKTESP
jgi:hypothetical protein